MGTTPAGSSLLRGKEELTPLSLFREPASQSPTGYTLPRIAGSHTKMGNVISALLCLYCRSGCRASTIASALTFHPPLPPYYDFAGAKDDHGKEATAEYADDAEAGKDKAAGGGGSSSGNGIGIGSGSGSGSGLTKTPAGVAGPQTTVFAPDLPTMPKHLVELHTAHMLVSANGTMVPVMLWTSPKAQFTIIVSHGNAADLGSMFYFNCLLNVELKANVVAYDYTGYGASAQYGTRPTENQTYGDIECVYDWICSYDNGILIGGPTGDPGKCIIAYGQSVGSGPSCYLASNTSWRHVSAGEQEERQRQRHVSTEASVTAAQAAGQAKAKAAAAPSGGGYPNVGSSGTNAANSPPPVPYAPALEAGSCMRLTCCKQYTRRTVAGLVLHSPIMSGLRVLTQNRCLAYCDIYPNIDLVTSATSPVFVIHGNRDQEVPFVHGQRLQDAVPPQHRTPPWWVVDRGHNDVMVDNEDEFFTRMRRFLAIVKMRQRETAVAVAAVAVAVAVAAAGATSSSSNKREPMTSKAGYSAAPDADVAEAEGHSSSSSASKIALVLQQEKDYSAMVITAALK